MAKQRYSKSYIEYFKTEHWRLMRRTVLWRDLKRCQICGIQMNKYIRLDIHHYYYPHNPRDITPDGLVALCRQCHKIADKERITNPTKRYKYERPKRQQNP